MTDHALRNALRETEDSNSELEHALDHLKLAVGGAEDLLVQKTQNQANRFLSDFGASMTEALDFMEDRRFASYAGVFFMGCLLGSFISLRANRGS